ncbi:hypothetical protein, partial [Micromonospora fulviviridis]
EGTKHNRRRRTTPPTEFHPPVGGTARGHSFLVSSVAYQPTASETDSASVSPRPPESSGHLVEVLALDQAVPGQRVA